MRSVLIFLSLSLLVSFASAETFYSTIHSIDKGENGNPHLVRFNNGRAAFIDEEKYALFTDAKSGQEQNILLKVYVDQSNNISEFQDHGVIEDEGEEENAPQPVPFRPTVVKTNNEALKIFNKMRKDYTQNGECFNRAHIWTVEENKRSGKNLMKIFMFFTERYIRKYNYHWWFHVTPMVYVGNSKSPRTLDRRYNSGPRQTKAWSDGFIKSKKTCKKVTKFDDFFLNQQKQDCYHIHTSMYYVVPRDIEKRDLTGVEKTSFSEKEIMKAYKNAFRRGR